MKKIKTTLIGVFLAAPALITVNAAPVCKTLSGLKSGAQLVPQASCAALISEFVASNKFPDVNYNLPISATQTIQLCYLSNGSFNLQWGTTPITVQTVSIWTDSSAVFGTPFILDQFGANGAGTIGTVATRWTVTDANGNVGKIYTRDTVNLAPAEVGAATPEIDVLVGGEGFLGGAKGSIQLSSLLEANGEVLVETLSGKVCIDN
jgi:hypothetical protein